MSIPSTIHGSKSLLSSVMRSMKSLYPLELADKSWDNTGLLLESPFVDPGKRNVLLTIDLTRSVAQEAIQKGAGVIVAYHPIIFRGLKSLTMGDSQQSSLLQLAAAGISVYCPHTSVDAAIGGINDWLANGVSGGGENERSREAIEESQVTIEGHEGSGMGRLVTLREGISFLTLVTRIKLHLGLHNGHEGSGMGRLVTLREGISFLTLVTRIKLHLGLHNGGLNVDLIDGSVQASIAEHHSGDNPSEVIKTIGICAGSGGSVFRRVKADVFFTGELGHHELLANLASGTSTVICGHSNTERGFLSAVMQHKLATLLSQDSLGAKVLCSEEDRDPLVII
ncbi:Protein NIF3 [Neolecta irregularis DAH-3]|uniref:Protein NIF3 n=1 Tax=Neolecta irregularis (strain DAH-3) TaxID=1198029 RepID=A0A1U7LIL9_NEOID|nr:Protein NIF3 [Neolecta irregularis DAH-3]|eukprot:OLL22489.1 Protein NIF3 [Neolecta irregularis DAH-3]